MADTDFSLGMDVSGYLSAGRQATAITNQLQASVASLTQGSALATVAFNRLIPLGAFSGLGKFAKSAADAQSQIASLTATSSVSGQKIGLLTREADKLSRSFSIGQAGGRQLIAQIQGMGVSSTGSEKQIGKLGEGFIKLAAATNSNSSVIATSMINVSRAFGDTRLDPARMMKMSDSLVTLKARFGGSAEGILAFTQSISPFARQAGISQQATMGIAAAFTKLGEDSGAASTAVNKVLSDITRSVRDGGPQMFKYASIVGMTAQSFEQLAKANPAEALTRVTEALGKPGVESQRQLESLGLDGIRTQRALTTLTQSGDLRNSISESVNASPGATDRASKEALTGLNDSMGKLEGTATQLAERLGGPVLDPLTKFVDTLTMVTGKVSDVMGNQFVGMLLKAMATLGVVATVGRVTGKVATGGVATIVGYRSGTARAFRAGKLAGDDDLGELATSLAAQKEELSALNPMNIRKRRKVSRKIDDVAYALALTEGPEDALGRVGPMNRRAFGFGQGLKTGRFSGEGPPPGTFEEQSQEKRLGFFGGLAGYGSMAYAGIKNQGSRIFEGAQGNPLKNVNIQDGDLPTRTLTSGLGGVGSKLIEAAKLSVGRGGGKEEGSEEDPAAGFTAALDKLKEAAGDTVSTFKRTNKDLAESSGSVNRSFRAAARSAMSFSRAAGRAGLSAGAGMLGLSMTPAGLLTGAALVGGYFMNKRSEAQKAEEEKLEGFRGASISKSVDVYNDALGRASQSTLTMADVMDKVAGKISRNAGVTSMSDAKSVTDEDAAAVAGKDGKNNYIGSVSEVAARINAETNQSMDPAMVAEIRDDLLAGGRSKGTVQQIMDLVNTDAGALSGQDTKSLVAAVANRATGRNKLEGGGKESIAAVSEALAQQFDSDNKQYGGDYASDQRNIRMNEIVEDLKSRTKNAATLGDSGDVEAVMDEFTKAFGVQLNGKGRTVEWSDTNPFLSTKGVAKPDVSQGAAYSQLVTGPNQVDPNGPIANPFNYAIGRSKAYAGMTENQRKEMQAPNDLLTNLKPGSAKELERVVSMFIKGANDVGMGMDELSVKARLAAANLDPDDVKAQALNMVAGRAQAAYEITAPTQGAQMLSGIRSSLAMANMDTDNTKLNEERIASTQQGIDLIKEQSKGMMQQRLQAELSYQHQLGRATSDFNRGMANSEKDFQRGRARAQRDFNKSMARMSEDAAKSMYDPYRRAGVEALWDSTSLLVNLGDQQERMNKQIADLAKLRKAGLSDQAIETLSLADSSKQQQASLLVNNLSSDPDEVKQLNAAVANRVTTAGKLSQDAGNTSTKRGREDFLQGLKDQNTDFQITNDRARKDFARSNERMREDMRRSVMVINTDFASIQKNFNKLINGESITFSDLMTDSLKLISEGLASEGKNLYTVLSELQAALTGQLADQKLAAARAAAGQVAGQGSKNARTEFGPSVTSSGSGGAADGIGMGYKRQVEILKDEFPKVSIYSTSRPGAITSSGNLSYHSMGRAVDLTPNMAIFNWLRQSYPNSRELIYTPAGKAQLKNGASHVYGPTVAKGHYDHIHWAMAKGGIAKATRGGIKATLAEAGHNEAVIPLNRTGVDVLAKAMKAYISLDQAKMLSTSGARTHITYDNSSHVNDHSVRIEKVEVQAQDAGDLFRQLQNKQRSANLTSTATRK